MEGKILANNNIKNVNKEFEKRNNKKMLYNNIIKSTQKSSSRISLFTKKQSNRRNSKKENNINLKNKDISVTKLKKQIIAKKDIKKEKPERINIISGKERIKTKINSSTKKKPIKSKKFDKDNNKDKEKENCSKNNNIYNNMKNNEDIRKSKQNTSQKDMTPKKRDLKESIYDSPFLNNNLEDDLVTSFERKPSDLKSPETVSEDSFITEDDIKLNKKNNKEVNNEKKINEKNTIENNNVEKVIKNDENEDNLLGQENEIIYVDKAIDLNENGKIYKKEEDEKRNEVNIKVNVKTSIFNDMEKNENSRPKILNYINQSQKSINQKINYSNDKTFNYSNSNLNANNNNNNNNNYNNNNKNNNNNNNNNNLSNNFMPKIQKSITLKKNKILKQINVSNIETKYNRNTNKNNQTNYLEPIQELKKNLSNQSLKFCSEQKLLKINKKEINDRDRIYRNLSQLDDGEEVIIFHKKLKIDEEIKDNKKRNFKDLSSSNNKNTNISTSFNYTSKDDDIRNKKISKDKIVFKIKDNKDNNNNSNSLINNNIKLIKDNQPKNKSEVNTNRNKNKNRADIYYLKKNSYLINKNSNKLALSIDDSNAMANKCKKISSNMSGNNIIYAPKKPGMNRVRSQEKATGNIYSNMSYNPNRVNKINQSNHKRNYNDQNLNYITTQKIDNLYSRKDSEIDMNNFFEKNNSFCGEMENYDHLLLNNENSLNSLRLNLFNNMHQRMYPLNYGSFSGNTRMGANTNSLNHFNKTAEKSNNSLFMLNRISNNGDRININLNNYLQNQNYNNRVMNMGINLNTDFNNYNINMINKNSFINQMNQYPAGFNLGMMSPYNNSVNQPNLINIFNNNFPNFNTIQNKASSFINNYSLNDSLYYFPNNNQNNSPSINIEDIIILQEKLKDIIIALNKTKIMANECFEFWNFYYNCSIYCQLEKLFTNPIESNTVRISINYELITIMICYDYSFENELLEKTRSILLCLIKLNYQNLIIICEHILSKISNESINNIWVKKLENIINSYKINENIKNNNMSPVESINYNTNIIIQNLRIILKSYKTMRNECLINFLNNIRDQTYEQINIFFREYILRTINLNGSILASVYLRNNKKFNTLPAPYVRTKNNKEFSLVLDLDETLVHFKEKLDGEGSGILQIRPGINEFLDKVGKYYELIIFTTATQDYADLLIDAVEEDKIYFDHRLYRDHAVIIDNDFVKDLGRIGRPLDKIIIVDNMPQNFKLQKENGIMIKAFWGEDNYDRALIDLIPILVNIAEEGGDVRKGLEKYKDDILKKISSSISEENI